MSADYVQRERDAWYLVDDLPVEQRALICEVMARFDFHRLRLAMVAVDWRWSNAVGEAGAVPTVERMRATALGLLVSVVTGKALVSSASGGFWCGWVEEDDGRALSLQFQIADYTTGAITVCP